MKMKIVHECVFFDENTQIIPGCVYEVEFKGSITGIQNVGVENPTNLYVFLGYGYIKKRKWDKDYYFLAKNGGYLPINKSWIKSMKMTTI